MLRIYGVFFFAALLAFSCGRGKMPVAGEKPANDTAAVRSQQPIPLKSDPLLEEDLRESAMAGNIGAVNYLLSRNVNLNSTDVDGRTAMMLAAFNGHTAIVKEFLDRGSPADAKDRSGRTALIYASTGPYPETVSLLLSRKADPNIADNDEKFTALMFAASEGHLEVVKVLLSGKADPSLRDKDNDNAETFARRNGHSSVADFIKSVSSK